MIRAFAAESTSTSIRFHFRGAALGIQRSFKTLPDDPKYVFSKPPKSPSSSSNKNIKDGKHFFTPPSLSDRNSDNVNDEVTSIGQAIASQRRRNRRRLIAVIFFGFMGTVLGYTIGYRALYLKEQSFIPLYPSSRVRKLSERDKRRIDAKQVENIARVRVLERLSQHVMIKEDYGVPLLENKTHETPKVKDFEMWCEDQDPCVTGIVIEPNDGRASIHEWYRIPFLIRWRITHRPISLSQNLNDFLNRVGLSSTDVFQIIAPENVYGSFKYEFPIQGDNHSLHIWFLGEMELDEDSLIVFKGKYHVDAKLQQIDLLRKEKNKLVRYILYKDDEK